ncbi:polymorphic toxin-type HINT domain-containing protein [Streptosporangium sp. H16]|uniref:polymorphic toxin-type HINT domain-containing protein n=1 Tax=Streptosporangium sp. H16 TaxID=3444184 RepID=UPI003F78E998
MKPATRSHEPALPSPETGKTEAKPVIALITGEDDKNLVQITVDTDGKKGDQTDLVIATEIHPFWAPALRKWVDAKNLKPGMGLRTSAGTRVQVIAIKKWTAYQRVHNLTIADIHTYYVLAGAKPVLVHNSNCDFKIGVADEKYDKHVLGLDDFGNPTRRPDMPEYDTDGGLERYVADAQALMCPGDCPAAAREAIRSDGVIIRMDSQGRIGMRNGNTITTYFRPDDPLAYFEREAAR